MASPAFATPGKPNLPDFLIFLTTVEIPIEVLPVDSPWPGYALAQAIDLVLRLPCSPGILYTLACYNGATHILFAITPDQTGQTYFKEKRSSAGFALNQPATGLVVSASDQGTSSTNAVPDWAKGLTVGQLDFYKTPWGRVYLQYQQSYGPTIVGLT